MSVPPQPNRRVDVELIQFGHEGLLYDPVTVRVHRLNATALLVWRCCDGTATVQTIAAELAGAFGEPTDVIAGAVDALIEELAGIGVLVGTSRPLVRPETRSPTSDDCARPAPDTARHLGPYSALDLRVTIDCHDAPVVADEIERAFASLATARADKPSENEATLVVWPGDGDWNLDSGGPLLTAPDESTVCDFVLWQTTRLAIEHSPRYLVVHASAVSRDGIAVVFPAEANSGKSTLATLLVEAGFDYLTDEATAIDLDTGEVVAYPKPITLDPGSQQLLPHLDPGGPTGDSGKWRIVPDDIRPGSVADRAVLTHLVLPTHVPGADTTLSGADTIDAVAALAAAAYNLGEHGHRLDELVALVERCTRHTLRHDGIDGPIAAIEALVNGTTP